MGKKVVKAMIATTGLMGLLGLSWVSDTKAAGADGTAIATLQPVDFSSKSAAATPTLGAAPVPATAFRFASAVHVPEFVGTLMAFLVMAWALESRRVV